MNKTIFLLGILSLAGSSFAQVRLGQEFRINTTTTESELRPRVASISPDRFFVCWESENLDNQTIDIHGQLFDANGAKIGSEIKINQRETAFKPGAQVISLGANFIVVWEYDTTVENKYNIYARVYGKDGTPKTDEIELVSGYYNYSQDNYRIGVASLNNENFIVSWNDISNIQWIRFRIFNAEAQPVSDIMTISTVMSSFGNLIKVIPLRDQRFLLCTEKGLVAQKSDLNGNKIGDAFAIDDSRNWSAQSPGFCHFKDGRLLVSWQSFPGWNEPKKELRCRILAEEGAYDSKVFQISPMDNYDITAPSPVSLSDNYFVVTWASKHQNKEYDHDVFAQITRRDGMPYGRQFILNAYREYAQQRPHACAVNENKYVVTWDSNHQDGHFYGVYAKLLPTTPRALDLESFAIIQPLNDAVVNTTSPTVMWNASTEDIIYPCEIKYQIQYSLDKDFNDYGTINVVGDTSASLVELQKGKLYYVKVVARNIDSQEQWSSNQVAFFVNHSARGEQTQDYLHIPAAENCDWIKDEDWTFVDSHLIEEDDKKQTLDFSPQYFNVSNVPNPFNPETHIDYNIPKDGYVTLIVYDVVGRQIKLLHDGLQTAGFHRKNWSGLDASGRMAPSGVYFCHLAFKGQNGLIQQKTLKMSLVR